MSPGDDQEDDAGAARRALVIDLDELCWALNSRDPLEQSSHWLNLESGEVLLVTEPDTLDDAADGPPDDGRWLRIEAIESSEAFGIMEDFVDQCDGTPLARALGHALQQRKPFRRFKDMLADHPEQRRAWFAFERKAMEMIARQWCEGHGIAPTWVAPLQPPLS